jgi:peptidoglycan/xylan/chitin deacetylase (PgdA/CDA1 family)
MDIYLTVDTEMWPLHAGNWPHTPLDPNQTCEKEFDAYFFGNSRQGASGLPYQLEMLARHGLKATFFLDPLFSFALGLRKLQKVIQLIERSNQSIGLHLHPEWLTDTRCCGLPKFRGPYISQYSEADQRHLVDLGWQRLIEAGGSPDRVFRAGSWGADVTTLRVLVDAGFTVDSSLNASFECSLPSLDYRDRLNDVRMVNGIVEVPVTRFDDGVSPLGRPLSLVGVSAEEMEFVLESCYAAQRQCATIVLHSDEFTRTDRLWKGREPTTRHLVSRRFKRLCGFLQSNNARFETRPIANARFPMPPEQNQVIIRSPIGRTARRWVGQAASCWY